MVLEASYIKTKMGIYGSEEDVNELLDAVKDRGQIFTFRKVLPVPTALDIEHSIRTIYSPEVYQVKVLGHHSSILDDLKELNESFEGTTEEFVTYLLDNNLASLALGNEVYYNMQKYSLRDAEEWKQKYWPGKVDAWGAEYDPETSELTFRSNGYPFRIVKRLVEKFRTLSFHCRWSDVNGTDIGEAKYDDRFNTAKVGYHIRFNAASEKAKELYLDCWGRKD